MTGDKQHKNILVIKLGALGDFIQALGPMAAIRNHHPESHITCLTTVPFVQFAKDTGYCDTIWTDTRPRWHQPLAWLELRRKLNAGHFTRVYDLQNNDRTALYLRLFKPRPEWIGAAPGASHRNTSPARTAGQAFDGHVQTLAQAGIEDIALDTLDWIKADISRFNLPEPYILIVPGSAPNHPEKRWPAAKYGALCKALIQNGQTPVLIGTQSEKNVTAQIMQVCPQAKDLTAQTSLSEIAVLARKASGAVGNDTGPMHMIAPTGCPSVILFSQHSTPVRHAPKGPHLKWIQTDNLPTLDSETVLKRLQETIESKTPEEQHTPL